LAFSLFFGVTIESGAGNLVGGTAPADRKVFAGIAARLSNSGAAGIQIRTTQAGTRIKGNYIGINAAGDSALGNGRAIDLIGSDTIDCTIGGLEATGIPPSNDLESALVAWLPSGN
jgi:hypothetical protein